MMLFIRSLLILESDEVCAASAASRLRWASWRRLRYGACANEVGGLEEVHGGLMGGRAAARGGERSLCSVGGCVGHCSLCGNGGECETFTPSEPLMCVTVTEKRNS